MSSLLPQYDDALLVMRGSSLDWGGNVLREHLALRKQLSPSLTPICLQGGACPFLPLQGSSGGKKRRKAFCSEVSSYLSGFGRRFYVGDPVAPGQVLRLPGLHCSCREVTFIPHQHHGNII